MIGTVGRCDVLFLIRSMGRGGAERQLSVLARALGAQGLNIVVAVFYAGGALERELLEAGVEVLDLQKAGRWSNIGIVRRLLAFVRERRPRVLHSYMPTQNLLALLLRRELSQAECAVVCGVRVAAIDAWSYGVIAGAIDWLHRRLIGCADLVVTNSSRALRELQGNVRDGRGVSIPNGFEHRRFQFSEEARASQRQAWGTASSEVLIGLVGRLDPQKNHALLLEALGQAGADLENARVVFVGTGPAEYRKVVAAKAEALGLADRIHWAGSTDDLASAYSALDVLCLCSVTEGFPNVLAEAMCVGLPCVTTDVGDAALVVGDCGWVVPPNDARALASALIQACSALPIWNPERPRQRVMQEFSADALASRTLAALTPFLERGR